MAKIAWGLDIGEWSIKVARGTYDKKSGTITVDLFDTIRYKDLSCGVEADTLEKYREGIRTFGERYVVGKKEDLCVAISGNEVFSRFINLPPVPERLSEIIRYEARQQIPFDMNRVVWDYQPIKEEFEPGEEIEVGLFALKEDRVNEFMEMLRPWEHNLRIIQDAPLAVYNFLHYERRTEEPLVVLDVGARTTDILVVHHPRFWIRPLLVAGNDITQALQERFDISSAEAERVKERVATSRHRDRIMQVIRPVAHNLVGEIQRSLGYYKSVDRGVKLERILLLGDAFRLPGLDQMLADELQYEVTKLGDVKSFQLGGELDPDSFTENLGGACTSLGLLAQAFEQGHMRINLVPEQVQVSEEVRRKRPWAMATAATVLLAVLVLFGAEMIYGSQLEKRKDAGKDLLQTLNDYDSRYSEQKSKVDEMKGMLADLSQGVLPRDFYVRVVPQFASTLPDNVFVSDLRLVWLEPSEVQAYVAPQEQTGMGSMYGGMSGEGATGEAAVGLGDGMYGGSGGPMGPPGGMGGMYGDAPGMSGGPMGPPGGSGAGRGYGGTGMGYGGPGMGYGGPGMGYGGSAGQMEQAYREQMMGGEGGGMYGMGAGEVETGPAQKSQDSKLVVWFMGESGEEKSGIEYIEQNVIERFKGMTKPGSDEPLFEEVKMLGEPRKMWRSTVTGQRMQAPGGGRGAYGGGFSGGTGPRGMGGPRGTGGPGGMGGMEGMMGGPGGVYGGGPGEMGQLYGGPSSARGPYGRRRGEEGGEEGVVEEQWRMFLEFSAIAVVNMGETEEGEEETGATGTGGSTTGADTGTGTSGSTTSGTAESETPEA